MKCAAGLKTGNLRRNCSATGDKRQERQARKSGARKPQGRAFKRQKNSQKIKPGACFRRRNAPALMEKIMTNPTRKPDKGKRKRTNHQSSIDTPRNWPGAAPAPFTQEDGNMPTGKQKTNTSKKTTSKKNASTLTSADLAKLEASY